MNHEPHFHFGLVSVEEGIRNEPLVMDTYIMYFDKHHFNMENRFVIHPDQTIIAVPCNNHNPDKKTCLIPVADHRNFLHLKLTNISDKPFVVPAKASLFDVCEHPHIKYK